jgi:hypothetical protein
MFSDTGIIASYLQDVQVSRNYDNMMTHYGHMKHK